MREQREKERVDALYQECSAQLDIKTASSTPRCNINSTAQGMFVLRVFSDSAMCGQEVYMHGPHLTGKAANECNNNDRAKLHALDQLHVLATLPSGGAAWRIETKARAQTDRCCGGGQLAICTCSFFRGCRAATRQTYAVPTHQPTPQLPEHTGSTCLGRGWDCTEGVEGIGRSWLA